MPRGGSGTALAAGIEAGITAGRGEHVRMVDGDDSHPFDDLGGFVTGFRLSLTRIGED